MVNNTSIKTGLKVEIQIQFLLFFILSSISIALALLSSSAPSLPLSSSSPWQWSEGVRVINRWCPMCFSSPVVLSLLLFHSPPFPVSAHRTPSPTACSFLSAKRESLEQPGLRHTCTHKHALFALVHTLRQTHT